MSKIKIEIKNRWTGSVLFEYEKENNTLKDTLEEAIKEGADLKEANLYGADLEKANLYGANLKGANLEKANLYGANLKGADLKEANLYGADLYGADLKEAYLYGANLKGAIIYYTDYNINDIQTRINNLINETNIEKMEVYENHNQIPTRWNCIWENVLVVKSWALKEKKVEPKKMTVSEVCKELGYDIEIVKD